MTLKLNCTYDNFYDCTKPIEFLFKNLVLRTTWP